MLVAKTADGASKSHLEDLKYRLKRFCVDLGDENAATIFGQALNVCFPAAEKEQWNRHAAYNRLAELEENPKAAGISKILHSYPSHNGFVTKLGPDPIEPPLHLGDDRVVSFVGAYLPACFVLWVQEISRTSGSIYAMGE